jgi:enoyl-CoA hydratase/carnithine racemase
LTPDDSPRLGLSEFGRFLIAPDAAERLSPVGASDETQGPGALVLDLSNAGPEETATWGDSVLEHLPILPCVTIALAPDRNSEEGVRQRILDACDVVVDSAEAATLVLDGFQHTPIAALAFVQLLRSASRQPIHAGLIAESFVYSTLQSGEEFTQWIDSRKRRKKSPRKSRIKKNRPDEGPACRMERDRERLDVRFARPSKHNAFSRDLRDGLCEALQLALADPTLELIVLSGEGASFCSGGDLDEFGSFPNPAEAHAIRTTRSPALLLSRLAGRVRTEVHGACIGAGAELPAFTNHVLANEDAFFELPEVRMGLVPGAGGTVSLPLRIGRQRTAWLGLSGQRIDAQTALAWGLVDEVRLRQHVGPDVGSDTVDRNSA